MSTDDYTFTSIAPGQTAHGDGCPATMAPHCFKGAPDAPTTHFRVTRLSVYKNPNCPGHKDVSARQGHYVDACCATQAARIVNLRLINRGDYSVSETLDVQVWR